MLKFMMMFKMPPTPEPFENLYNDFLALTERMPHVTRYQVVLAAGSPMGEPAYYRILELYYATQGELEASLLSAEGQEAGAELQKFGAGMVDVMFAEVYEENHGARDSHEEEQEI